MAVPDFRPAQTTHGGHPMVVHYTTLTGETFSAGQCVKVDLATGHVEECASTEHVLGVALADADPGNEIPIAVCDGNTIFSAKNTGTAFAIGTHQNQNYSLEVSGGVHGVNVGTGTTNPIFRVIGVDTTDTAVERVLVATIDLESEFSGDADPI